MPKRVGCNIYNTCNTAHIVTEDSASKQIVINQYKRFKFLENLCEHLLFNYIPLGDDSTTN